MKTIFKIVKENNKFVYLFIYGLLTGGMLSFTSCEDDMFSVDNSVPNRMFRPVAFTVSPTSSGANFNWVPISGASSYYLEVSKDSLQFTEELQKISLGIVSAYQLTDLLSKTRYSARIKTVSGKPELLDSDFNSITFVTP